MSGSTVRWMASVKSVPTRSAFSSGPSTARRRPKLALITVSTVSASQMPCSTSAIASRHSACCRRLPTKPGTSFLTCTGIFQAAGKMPVHVRKDVPGFVGNRLQHALWREAIALVEHGICDAETVDTVIKASFGRRLAVLGPLENADLVGTDLTLAIHQTVLADIEHRPGPSPYLEALVANGKLGFKSGEGFRTWSADAQAALRGKVLQHLKKARASDA